MGLDMYLTARVYASKYSGHDAPKLEAMRSIPGLPSGFSTSNLLSVEATVAQWRKANQVHDWFVKTVQGGHDECQTSYVNRDDLKSLLDRCRRVLADHSLAESLLPTASGFFFGSTQYDDYYFQDLQSTIEMLEPLLGEEYKDCAFFYHASW